LCYQGFSVAVISMAAYKALYFGLYNTAKNLLLPEVRIRRYELMVVWDVAFDMTQMATAES
jgi:hypothetical protein